MPRKIKNKDKVVPFKNINSKTCKELSNPMIARLMNIEPSNNIDEDITCVFVTPQELIDLSIGYTKDLFIEHGEDLNGYVPWSVEGLRYSIQAATIGIPLQGDVTYSVENSQCEINLVININGKYCKLDKSEWEAPNQLLNSLRLIDQMCVFQRLLKQGQITFDDLAAADIDNNIFQQLAFNETSAKEMYTLRQLMVDKWIDRQLNDPVLYKMYRSFMKSIS